MRRWMRRSAGAAGVALGGVVAAAAVAAAAWSRATARDVRRLDLAAPGGAAAYRPEELEGLPEPAARYFRWALTPGQPLLRAARIEHEGEFRGGVDAPWSPFTSVQHFRAGPPGFVWDARIRMAPLVEVRVRDSYLAGRAAMLGRIAALVPVVAQEGSPQLASGALHRWLAEAVWIPTALLPRHGVRWEPVDANTARATLADHGTTVSLEMTFAADGAVTRVRALRYRDMDGVGVLTPWEGRFRAHGRMEGMRIPLEGEVEWVLPEGALVYWRGRIVRAEYRFAPRGGAPPAN